jgi:hypothetical protein
VHAYPTPPPPTADRVSGHARTGLQPVGDGCLSPVSVVEVRAGIGEAEQGAPQAHWPKLYLRLALIRTFRRFLRCPSCASPGSGESTRSVQRRSVPPPLAGRSKWTTASGRDFQNDDQVIETGSTASRTFGWVSLGRSSSHGRCGSRFGRVREGDVWGRRPVAPSTPDFVHDPTVRWEPTTLPPDATTNLMGWTGPHPAAALEQTLARRAAAHRARRHATGPRVEVLPSLDRLTLIWKRAATGTGRLIHRSGILER